MIEDHSSILKIFEVKYNLKIFGNSSRSSIFREYLDNRDRRPFKDLLKIFDIKESSRIFERSSRSKVIQESSKNLRDQISFKDNRKISRSKVIQGTPDVLHDRRSFKYLGKFFEVEDSSKIFENTKSNSSRIFR